MPQQFPDSRKAKISLGQHVRKSIPFSSFIFFHYRPYIHFNTRIERDQNGLSLRWFEYFGT